MNELKFDIELDKSTFYFVYVFVLNSLEDKKIEFYKIGYSGQPHNRLRSLNSSLITPNQIIKPVYLRLFRDRGLAIELENSLHHKFRHKNTKGEWFKLDLMDFREIIDDKWYLVYPDYQEKTIITTTDQRINNDG